MITTHDGLLWEGERKLGCMEADSVARESGFHYAERYVKHLQLGLKVGDTIKLRCNDCFGTTRTGTITWQGKSGHMRVRYMDDDSIGDAHEGNVAEVLSRS